MFVEANKLIAGLKPYKEIFITYGILTTILHAASLVLFGNKIMSIYIMTSMFYAFSFLIYYFILRNLNINKKLSIISVILIFFIHPTIILPWANYFAYFFLLLGVFFLTKKNFKINYFIYTGFFWSLAVLCRQTFALSLGLTILTILGLNLILKLNIVKKNIQTKENKYFVTRNIFCLFLSFLVSIFFFFLYLNISGNFEYWKYATFDISKTYLPGINDDKNYISIEIFLYFFEIFRPLISNLFFSIKNFDIRYFIFFIIFIFNLFFLLYFFIKKRNFEIFFISCLSLLLFSESIHLPEVFRMSTGPILGFITILFFFQKFQYVNYIFLIFIFLLSFTWWGGKHNYSYEYYYKPRVEKNLVVGKKYFQFQKLPKNVVEFYNTFEDTLKTIDSLYIIKWNYNYSGAPILGLISNTKSYQIGSFHDDRSKSIYQKRKDIDLQQALRNFNDIIIFYPSNKQSIPVLFEKNFRVISIIEYPFQNLKNLLILIPKNVSLK